MTSAVSVKARLKNQAAAGRKTMQEALTIYGMERTMYRLSVSEYAEEFTLKGGIFLYALFEGEFTRATRDIDLLAKNVSNSVENIRRVFEKIFSIEYDDALRYDLNTLEARAITEFKEYHGVNVSILAYLDRTKIPISIDIGFNDVIYPGRVKMEFPVLLDMKAPLVYAYSLYSVISEKFEAIVSLGNANSRYKDFYDIYILSDKYEFDGKKLKEAVRETFDRRATAFDDIIAFEDDFLRSEIHQKRWTAFMRKKKTLLNVEFEEAIDLIKKFLMPVVESIKNNTDYCLIWDCKNQSWKQRYED